MKGTILLLTTLLVASSCNTKNKEKAEDPNIKLKVEMLETDRAFSAMSRSRGLRKAFMNFIDNDAVLLRPNSLPLAGGEAMDLIIRSNDSTSILTWEPKDGFIAAAGDMGYTYGVYSRKPGDEDSVYYGTYVTIWKRQPAGNWKFVLQSGNEGVE
jgi:ketosteroid isomerase-like protein